MSIGQRIKDQRNKKGLTQSELAKNVGITLDMVKSMETNRSNPSIETLSKLCDTFNVSADYLLGRDEETIELKRENLRRLSDGTYKFIQEIEEYDDSRPPLSLFNEYFKILASSPLRDAKIHRASTSDPRDLAKYILKLIEEEFAKLDKQENK